MDITLIVSAVGGYIAGIVGLSYMIGKERPYTAFDNPGDYILTLGWPVLLVIGLVVLPIVLPIFGIIKGIEFIASLGSRHTLEKRDREIAQREAETRIDNMEMFEDTVI